VRVATPLAAPSAQALLPVRPSSPAAPTLRPAASAVTQDVVLDPFAPGLRWTRSATSEEPWIPKSLVFGAGGALVWAAESGANPRLDLFTTPGIGSVEPFESSSAVASSTGALAVAAGKGLGAFFALAQFPDPDARHRRTELTRYDPLSAAEGARFAPVWMHTLGFTANGPARVACDESGARVIVAAWNDQQAFVRVDRVDGADGTLLARRDLPAAALSEIALSADGARALICGGLDAWELDLGLDVIGHQALASATSAVCLSGDGRRIAIGGIGKLTLLEDVGAGYVPTFAIDAPAHDLAARAGLSRDARTLAIGWWNFVNGVDLRFEVWDANTHGLIHAQSQTGTPGGLQNVPSAVCVTPDGKRAAFGCWGDGTTKPEIVLVDRDQVLSPLQVDLPGSVLALALDASGTEVAVGMKDAHANEFATTGSVRLYDSGERDIQALSAPHPGTTLELAAKHAGTSTCLFLEGPLSPVPLHVAGTSGSLWLVRNGLRVTAKPADGTGRADLGVPLGESSTSIGTHRHFQAAFRVNGTLVFSQSLVDALIL
jgi:hypothetical protein